MCHAFEGDFIHTKAPVITLAFQRLKTGDIIEGIPKVEQFFEARTTKRGRLFRDSLPNLLKGLFGRYKSIASPFRFFNGGRDSPLGEKQKKTKVKKSVLDTTKSFSSSSSLKGSTIGLYTSEGRGGPTFPVIMTQDQAVRQSFYKIQQIIVDGVQRVYRSQGVSIADKHLEVIVRQMTSKVIIVKGGQTGFFPGEIVDLGFVEQVNSMLISSAKYEPIVLGITKASLQVDSFLSAASFQQTTRILSEAAICKKKDFLKGLKENVILGNLIPAGTGFLVYISPFTPSI